MAWGACGHECQIMHAVVVIVTATVVGAVAVGAVVTVTDEGYDSAIVAVGAGPVALNYRN